MWWQKARIIFLFSPYWSSGGYAQERWKHGGVFPALLGRHWCEEELWDFWLRDYIHCAAGLMTSHTQPYTHTYWVCTTSRTQAAGRSQWGWQRSGVEWQTEKMIVIILSSFFFLINNDSQFSIYLVNSQNSRYSKTNTVEDVVEKSG